MPAARRESVKERVAGAGIVEMKGLRIEFRRKALDPVAVDAPPRGAIALPDSEVFEIPDAHDGRLRRDSVAAVGRGRPVRPNHAPPAIAEALIKPNAASAAPCAINIGVISPLQRSTSHPPPAAIVSR